MTDTHLTTRLPLTPEQLDAFCRRHHIRRLAFFGSVLRDDFGPASDVDVLVEYEPGHHPNLSLRLAITDDLAALLGRDVDLLTFDSPTPRARARILADAQLQYDRDRGGVLTLLADDGRRRRRPTVQERDQVYLGQMVDAATEAVALMKGIDRAEYNTNRILRLAIERLVQNVGEAARRLSPTTRARHPDIPWHQINGMRNVLVHDYDQVDSPTVWDVVTHDLPIVIAELAPLVGPPPPPPTEIA